LENFPHVKVSVDTGEKTRYALVVKFSTEYVNSDLVFNWEKANDPPIYELMKGTAQAPTV
jgi:hypothetical protein